MDQGTADDGAGYGAERPHTADDAKPFAADAKGYEVRDNDFCQGNEATATDTLERAASKKDCEVIGYTCNDGSDKEET